VFVVRVMRIAGTALAMQMSASSPVVGIIVVNYNSAPFIDEFCGSLQTISYPSWRLIVVDSGSTDDSLRTIESAFAGTAGFAAVRCNDNVGFAAGVNVPFDRQLVDGCDLVLFLNNDTTLSPDFLSRLVNAADDKSIVVPKILYSADHRLISTHAGGFDWKLGVFRDTFAELPDGPATSVRRENLDTASFCCALVPVQAFREVGRLDERFFMYYEETDWIRRAQARGYRVRYEPAAVIYHRESASSGGGWMTPFKQYYSTRNRAYLVRKAATSRLSYGYFTVYYWCTRIVRALQLASRGQWRLLRALTLGMFDYYRGRMGRTRQVQDL
jgi:GT2 family glycosyltransferase